MKKTTNDAVKKVIDAAGTWNVYLYFKSSRLHVFCQVDVLKNVGIWKRVETSLIL